MCALNTVQIGLFDIVFEFFLNAFAFLLGMLGLTKNEKEHLSHKRYVISTFKFFWLNLVIIHLDCFLIL